MKKEVPENEASYLSHGLREAVFLFIPKRMQWRALLTAASAVRAASISKSDLICRHLETLERLDRLPDNAYLPFVSEQLKAKECVTTEGDSSWPLAPQCGS
jgi:hypothetical protein